jgi:S-formylglutathione hydrolase FrmB
MAAAERLAASGKPKPNVYIWCGTEDFLYQQNVKMRGHLEKLGYNLTYEESPGDHSWPYWDAKIQTVLDWLPLAKKEEKEDGAYTYRFLFGNAGNAGFLRSNHAPEGT